MHEASIALNILSIAEEHCRRAGYSRVESVEVRIGKASGVLAEALFTAFDMVKAGTISEHATLVVDGVPVGGACRACGLSFTTEDQYVLKCPHCGSQDFTIRTGREMEITGIEVA